MKNVLSAIDGGYNVDAVKRDEKIVALKEEFICDDEEDYEDEDE